MFYYYILMVPFTVAVFWLLKILQESKGRIVSRNYFVVLAAFLAALDVVMAQSVANPKDPISFYLDIIDCFVTPAAIPIAYYYIHSLTVNGKFKKWECLLLFPSLFVGCSNLVINIVMGSAGHMASYPNMLEHAGQTIAQSSALRWFIINEYAIFNAIAAIMLVSLGGAMYYDLSSYRHRLENYYADVDNKGIDHVSALLLWGIAIVLFNVLLTMVHRSFLSAHPVIAISFFIVAALLQFFFFYNGYKIRFSAENLKQEIAENAPEDSSEESSVVIPIIAVDYQQTVNALSAWLTRGDKPYLAEGITIDTVAEGTGLRSRMVSTYLNNVLHLNFNSWINGYRIEEAKRLLLDPEKYTTLYIAAKCGMTDAASFTRLFKRFVGMTPTEFRKKAAV